MPELRQELLPLASQAASVVVWVLRRATWAAGRVRAIAAQPVYTGRITLVPLAAGHADDMAAVLGGGA